MINRAVIKETIRENLIQPFFLLAALFQLSAVLFFSFVVEFRYENDILTGISLFGKMTEDQVQLIGREFLRTFSGLVVYITMFLFIIGGSSTHTGILLNPLTNVSLTRPLSRSTLFVSKFLGLWILVAVLVMAFSVVLWSIAYYKSSGNVSPWVLLAPVFFSFEFFVIFAFSAFIAMLVENPTGVAILTLAVYFYAGRLIGFSESLPPFLQALSLLLPPTGVMSAVTTGSVISGQADFGIFYRGLFYAVICLCLGTYLFHRKDLR